jgi:hypothetical protein
MPQDSEIQNEIDSIATLLNQTVYKLKFLKWLQNKTRQN